MQFGNSSLSRFHPGFPRHRVAGFVYYLVSGLDLQIPQHHYAIDFRRARAAGPALAVRVNLKGALKRAADWKSAPQRKGRHNSDWVDWRARSRSVSTAFCRSARRLGPPALQPAR